MKETRETNETPETGETRETHETRLTIGAFRTLKRWKQCETGKRA
jgi:hypothetical protein